MASGQLPLVCLLCQQIFNGVFSFSNTGRTLLIRSGISLIIFYLPLERTSKRYLVFEEFSKEFLFLCFTYHVTFFFLFWQQCQRRIFWKKILLLWLKETFIIYKSSYVCKKSSVESKVKQKWKIDLPKPMQKTC